jgi:hypothetical protein
MDVEEPMPGKLEEIRLDESTVGRHHRDIRRHGSDGIEQLFTRSGLSDGKIPGHSSILYRRRLEQLRTTPGPIGSGHHQSDLGDFT